MVKLFFKEFVYFLIIHLYGCLYIFMGTMCVQVPEEAKEARAQLELYMLL